MPNEGLREYFVNLLESFNVASEIKERHDRKKRINQIVDSILLKFDLEVTEKQPNGSVYSASDLLDIWNHKKMPHEIEPMLKQPKKQNFTEDDFLPQPKKLPEELDIKRIYLCNPSPLDGLQKASAPSLGPDAEEEPVKKQMTHLERARQYQKESGCSTTDALKATADKRK